MIYIASESASSGFDRFVTFTDPSHAYIFSYDDNPN